MGLAPHWMGRQFKNIKNRFCDLQKCQCGPSVATQCCTLTVSCDIRYSVWEILYSMRLGTINFSIICHSLHIDILVGWKVGLIPIYVIHSVTCSAIQVLSHPMKFESRRPKLIGFGALIHFGANSKHENLFLWHPGMPIWTLNGYRVLYIVYLRWCYNSWATLNYQLRGEKRGSVLVRLLLVVPLRLAVVVRSGVGGVKWDRHS